MTDFDERGRSAAAGAPRSGGVGEPRATDRLTLRDGSGSSAEVHLHGAQVTSWRTPDGVERLFLSRRASFAADAAIRGGIPVIFPQFADRGPYARHGFARTLPWRLPEKESKVGNECTLVLEDSAATRAMWPFAFRCELRVALEARTLAVELTVENRDRAVLAFTAALHSYLRVGEVARTRVIGLQAQRYESGIEGVRGGVDRRSELRIARELDRVYVDVAGPLEVVDGDRGATVVVEKAGFPDVVLWNPGPEKARALRDLAAGEEREFLCVEAAVVARPALVDAGSRWRGAQRMTVVEVASGSG